MFKDRLRPQLYALVDALAASEYFSEKETIAFVFRHLVVTPARVELEGGLNTSIPKQNSTRTPCKGSTRLLKRFGSTSSLTPTGIPSHLKNAANAGGHSTPPGSGIPTKANQGSSAETAPTWTRQRSLKHPSPVSTHANQQNRILLYEVHRLFGQPVAIRRSDKHDLSVIF